MQHACLRTRPGEASRERRAGPILVRADRPCILLVRLLAASALSLGLACTGCDSHEEAATPMAPPQVTVMPASAGKSPTGTSSPAVSSVP